MDANGITQLTMGSWLGDHDSINIKADNQCTTRRYVAGLEGDFDAFDTNWSWDTYFARSTTHNSTRAPDNILNDKFNQAVDSFVDPATGATVCRTTLTNPGDGCVPYNVFGIDVNSEAAFKFVAGTEYAITILPHDVFVTGVIGEPFATWAGPVSVAFGIEHHIEKVRGIESDNDLNRRFFAGNYRGTDATFNVTECYIETVVPMAKDETVAESLELNAAYRGTIYSEAGFVSTHKVGVSYAPTTDFTLGATRSRDIRAPNPGDLFNEGRAGTGTVDDSFTLTSPTVITAEVGNPGVCSRRQTRQVLVLSCSPLTSRVPGLPFFF